MLRAWLTRLLSTASILLIGMGGGGLPVLDGLLLHSRGPAEAAGPHFEATSGCHADGCSIRSTAQQVRLAPTLGSPARLVLDHPSPDPPRSLPVQRSTTPSRQLSRAPPHFG